MKIAPCLFAAILVATLGCSSSETQEDVTPVRQLDKQLLGQLDTLLADWSKLRNTKGADERARVERKIRRIVDRYFSAIRLGLHSPSRRKRAVCAAAVGFSLDIGVVPDLLNLLKDGNSVIRANALLSLTHIGYKRIPLDLMVPVLEDDDPVVRRLAVTCLEKTSNVLNEKGVGKELRSLMSDSDFGVRMNAAKALGTLGNVSALPVLVEKGLKDKDERVRYNAAIALAELKSFGAVESLVLVGRKEGNDAVRREIVRALRIITKQDYGFDFKSWNNWWLDFQAKKKNSPK